MVMRGNQAARFQHIVEGKETRQPCHRTYRCVHTCTVNKQQQQNLGRQNTLRRYTLTKQVCTCTNTKKGPEGRLYNCRQTHPRYQPTTEGLINSSQDINNSCWRIQLRNMQISEFKFLSTYNKADLADPTQCCRVLLFPRYSVELQKGPRGTQVVECSHEPASRTLFH